MEDIDSEARPLSLGKSDKEKWSYLRSSNNSEQLFSNNYMSKLDKTKLRVHEHAEILENFFHIKTPLIEVTPITSLT